MLHALQVWILKGPLCVCVRARWQTAFLSDALLIQCASDTPPVEGGDCSHSEAGSLCSWPQTKVDRGLLIQQGWQSVFFAANQGG